MPIDTSIYQNYLKPPKSIAEYGAEMDAADQNRMMLESGRMNLLAAKQAQADEQAVRAAYQQPGFDPQSDTGIMELMRLNPKAGFAAAEARQKALKAQADLGHVAAQTDSQRASAQKSTIEAAGTRLKQYRDTLDFIDTPEAAARWITAQFQDPLISGQMAALGSPEQAVSRIPRDPAGFQKWRQQAAMGMEKHIAEMRQQGVADQSARNDLIGPDGKVNPVVLGARQSVASAGKSVTNINTGQTGFNNEMKLRDDFKQEPIYKAHQEVQSAYQQIKSSLGQKSPAGDLAGATKIMKLLDPGSVVRESELGMAMAASGLMDRIANYAQMTMNGTKLTPTQRKDFQDLADKLHDASVQQFNTKRKDYEALGKDYGLNSGRALGPEASGSKVVDFGSLK